jgi:hypothetical protein
MQQHACTCAAACVLLCTCLRTAPQVICTLHLLTVLTARASTQGIAPTTVLTSRTHLQLSVGSAQKR